MSMKNVVSEYFKRYLKRKMTYLHEKKKKNEKSMNI